MAESCRRGRRAYRAGKALSSHLGNPEFGVDVDTRPGKYSENFSLTARQVEAGWSGPHVDSPRAGHHASDLRGPEGAARAAMENRPSTGQRCAYLSGGLQWFGDLLDLLFLVFLLAGAANLSTGGGQLFRKLTAFLVATVPVLPRTMNVPPFPAASDRSGSWTGSPARTTTAGVSCDAGANWRAAQIPRTCRTRGFWGATRRPADPQQPMFRAEACWPATAVAGVPNGPLTQAA